MSTRSGQKNSVTRWMKPPRVRTITIDRAGITADRGTLGIQWASQNHSIVRCLARSSPRGLHRVRHQALVAGHRVAVAVAVAAVAVAGDPQEVKIGDISRSHEKQGQRPP